MLIVFFPSFEYIVRKINTDYEKNWITMYPHIDDIAKKYYFCQQIFFYSKIYDDKTLRNVSTFQSRHLDQHEDSLTVLP